MSTNKEIIKGIEERRLILIMRRLKGNVLKISDAMCDAGVKFMEVTYDASGKYNSETNEQIKIMSEHLCGKAVIGAGTVISMDELHDAYEAGAKFIISPNVNTEIIRETKRLGLISIPGAFTPSEIQSAYEAGADFVKVFPASTVGSSYFKAVSAPLSNIRLLAVGGVRLETIPEYFANGVCGIGISAGFIPDDCYIRGDYDTIRKTTAKYVNACLAK